MGQVGYYDENFEPWVRGIRGIGTAIMQAPMLRAAAQERAQAGQLTQARIGTEGAQSRKLDAETANLVKKGQLVTALEQSAAQAQQDIAAGKTDTEAVRAFAGAASALTGANGDDIIASARQGIGTLLGRAGKVTDAAAVENPVELEKARIASNRGQVVQPGGALYKDGQVVFQNPSAASQQAASYEETTQEFPEKAATPGTPGTPGSYLHIFGVRIPGTTTPGTPAIPGTPGTPKRIVKTRRRIGDVAIPDAPSAHQAQDPDDPSEPIEEPAGQEDDAQTAAPGQSNSAAILAEAQQAIQKGADPVKVKARLKEKFGITLK